MSHIQHPYEDNDLTLEEANHMIRSFLNAEIPVMYEKADGFNMKVTWRNGQLLFAKTKKHLSSVDNALDREGLKNRYQGRIIQFDMLKAYDRIEETLSSLSRHALQTFFQDGRYLNVEVTGSFTNVFHYTKEAIILHNFLETTEDGETSISDEDIGDFYSCVDRNASNHIFQPKHRVFFDRKFTSLQSDLLFEHGDLKNTTIGDLKVQEMLQILAQPLSAYFSVNEDIARRVATRLALKNKQGEYGINSLRSDNVPDKVIDYIQDIESPGCNYFIDLALRNKIARNFELLGMHIIPHINSTFYSSDEDGKKWVKDIISRQVNDKLSRFNSGDIEVRDDKKVLIESNILNRRTGRNLEKYIPHSEGVVFEWKGKRYKLTGLFRSINYIMGLERHIR